MIDQANRLRDLVRQKSEQTISKPPVISARVITVTSGKGGVGKTNFTLNLAISFRRLNKRVVIIDADLGLANIEVLSGVIPRYNLGHVFKGECSITEAITQGPLGVQFLSGGSGLRDLANLNDRQISFIMDKFSYLDSVADYILIDTGAGISNTVINFIKASGETIIITTPEPTSITDAYAIIKTVSEESGCQPEFKIVVNRADNSAEAMEVFDKINKTSKYFLNVELDNLGFIPYDNNLVKAVKKQEPVSISFPNTEASRSIEQIGHKLLNIQVNEETGGIKTFMKRLAHLFTRS